MPSSAIPEQLKFPELVDINTAATLLAVNVRYMRRMVDEKRLPFVKMGRLLRFDLVDLRAWVEEHRRSSAT